MLAIRTAQADDIASIVRLIREAVTWLGEQGTEQWQAPRFGDPGQIEASVAAGTTWVVVDESQVVGTVVLDETADPEFWTPADDPGSALYLHRMVVARSHRGTQLGSAILDWAGRRAAEQGKQRVRLDAWVSNTALHRYYLSQGFQHVRTLHYTHRGSGALFERASEIQLRRGPALVEGVSTTS